MGIVHRQGTYQRQVRETRQTTDALWRATPTLGSVGNTGTQSWGSAANGAAAVTVGNLGDGRVGLIVRDGDGYTLIDAGLAITDDALSGFMAPALAMPMRKLPTVATDDDVAVTSSSFADVYEMIGYRGNAMVAGLFAAVCSTADTAGEAQLVDVDSGAVLSDQWGDSSPTTIQAGTTTAAWIATNPVVAPGGTGELIRVRLQVRRTDGTGTITCRPGSLTGAPPGEL
jgi:hypothetical protein